MQKRIRARLYPVPGHDGLLVSKDGHVAQVSKKLIFKPTGKPLIQLLSQNKNKGYMNVRYNNNSYLVHRLQLVTFKPNPDNKPFANHLNGIRHDNRIENIEWATQSENELHKIYVLNKDSQLKKRKVLILKNGIPFKEARSVSEAARKVKGNQSNISQCCLGKRLSHKGYSYQYLAETA